MFKKKQAAEPRKDFSVLIKRMDRMEAELERLEMVEKSLAQQELALAKKIQDINKMGDELKNLVNKDDFNELKKELKRIEKHEEVLAENDKFLRELVKELSKVKESHRLTRKHVLAKEHVKKGECEERFSSIKQALTDLGHIRRTHKKKAGHDDLALLKKELHDRLAQTEYQNKVLMNYLKKIDELLQKKT